MSYALDDGDEVIILHDNEYVDTFCDGDCGNCERNEDDEEEIDYNKIGKYVTIEDGYIKCFNNGEITNTLKIPENKE